MIWHVAWLCSGPGAMAAIERSEHAAQIALYVAIGVLVLAAAWLCVRSRRFRAALLPLALVLHPATCGNARGGDCGHLLNDTAWPATYLAIALAALVIAFFELSRYRARRHGG